MKRILKNVLSLVPFLAMGGNVHAGIPVFDGVQNVGRTLEFVETVIQWAVELEEMRAQWDELREQNRSANGARDWGSSARNNYETAETWEEVLTDTDYATVADAARIVDVADAAFTDDSDAAEALQNMQNQNAMNRVVTEEGYNRAMARLDNLEELANRINSASDQKDIQDLQARINSEQVLLQNENNRMAMVAQLQQNQRDIAEQQNRERLIKMSERISVAW